MATSNKAIVVVENATEIGVIVNKIETALTFYMRRKFKEQFPDESISNFEMRKRNFVTPSTTVFGSSVQGSGFSLFTHFSIGKNENRRLQICIKYPHSEYPTNLVVNDTDNTILLSIGDWGDSVEILSSVSSLLSHDGSYSIVLESGEIQLFEKEGAE